MSIYTEALVCVTHYNTSFIRISLSPVRVPIVTCSLLLPMCWHLVMLKKHLLNEYAWCSNECCLPYSHPGELKAIQYYLSFGWKLALRSDTNEDSNEKLNVAEGGGCILLVLTPETHTR